MNNPSLHKKIISVAFWAAVIVLFFTAQAFSNEKTVIQPETKIYLGEGWATNTINTVIFRHHGIITAKDFQFTAFYDHEGNIKLIKRYLPGNKTEKHIIPGEYNLFDAHNSISLGIDPLGHLHMSYDHHGDRLRYRRSLEPFSIDSWTDKLAMTDKHESKVTYPAFIYYRTNKGQRPLLFLYRHGSSSKGDAYLKEYNAQKSEWKDREPCILSGSRQRPWTSNAYWNHPVIDHTGRLHLSFVWRTHSIGPENRVNNINIDYAYSDDHGRTWCTSRDRKLKTPITQVNSDTAWAVSPGSNLINQASMAVDNQGHPHIVFYSNDPNGIPQYQHLWFDGKSWQHDFISKRSDPFVLAGGGTLQIPISRPEIVIDKQNRVYVIFRGDLTEDRMAVKKLLPPDYDPENSELKILWPENLEYAEPVIDRVRWRKEEILSMLIQRNAQPAHDRKTKPKSEPVYLVDWDIAKGWEKHTD